MNSVSKFVVKSVAAVALASAIVGCGAEKKPYRPSLTNPDASTPPKVGEPKTIDKMADDDVIVWVDGSALTKRGFDEAVGFVNFQFRRAPANMSKKQLMGLYNIRCRSIIPDFVNHQLLIHEARNRKLLDEPQLLAGIASNRAEIVKFAKKDLDAAAKELPGGLFAIDRLGEEQTWLKAMVETVPSVIEVDGSAVTNFIQIARDEALRVRTTNQMVRAKLEAIHRDIVAGKASFEDMAEKYSECRFKVAGAGGRWGSYRRHYFNDKMGNNKMGEAMFALQPGEFTDVQEDGQGYSIVKFLSYDDRFGAKNQEDRLFARIFLKKEPEPMIETFEEMKKSLSSQMKAQAVEKVIAELREKATVVYPHGEKLFDDSKASEKKGGR